MRAKEKFQGGVFVFVGMVCFQMWQIAGKMPSKVDGLHTAGMSWAVEQLKQEPTDLVTHTDGLLRKKCLTQSM